MSIINNTPNTLDYPFGTNFDGRLIRTSTSGIQLEGCGGSSKRAFVRDIVIDLSIPLTLTTNSSAEYIITGTTTVTKGTALSSYSDNSYTNYGLHYIYLCNYWDCWNFSGYNRQGKLIISPSAPAESGYLSDYGDGAGARQVGWIICNSSRLFDSDLCVASVFNSDVCSIMKEGSSTWPSLTIGNDTTLENLSAYVIIPKNVMVSTKGMVYLENDSASVCWFTIYIKYGSTVKQDKYDRASTNANDSYRRNISIEYEEVGSTTAVVQIKLNVLAEGAGSPKYGADSANIIISRVPPQQPTSFTRIYTHDYEDVARPMVGGRLERVSDTSLEWQPDQHGSIGIYNGLNWVVVTPPNNPSITNTVNDIDSAALTYDYNYDVYAEYSTEYSFNLVLKKWTDNTTRAVTPGRFQGVLVYDATTDVGRRRRFLGTVRLRNDSGAKFTDSVTQRYISNVYLLKEGYLYKVPTQNDHTYNSSTWRKFNADDSSKMELVVSTTRFLMAKAKLLTISSNSNTSAQIGLALDTTSSYSGITGNCGYNAPSYNPIALYNGNVAAGYHYLYMVEQSSANIATCNFASWNSYVNGIIFY